MLDATTQWEIVGRIALAAALGSVIGLEREYRGYPAGVRTMALVCMGAALFTDTSSLLGGDPGRLASNIVTGIGFLGAGLIVREGGSVRGITTAATIWSTAAVGVAVGAEAYIVALAGATFAVLLLEMRIITKSIRPSARGADVDENAHDPDE